MNRTTKDCLCSQVPSPRAMDACIERHRALVSCPDNAPTWQQAAAVIICAGAERLHGTLLTITPV